MNKLRLITGVFLFEHPINNGFYVYFTMDENTNEQPNNPLHGIKLIDMLEHLTATYSWGELASIVNINCFKSNPSIKSSLKFLRRTPWAREKVEQLYLKSIQL